MVGGGFDHLNCQYTEEFDKNASKKSLMPGGFTGGGMGGFGIDWYIKPVFSKVNY